MNTCGNYVDFDFKGRTIHIVCVGKPGHDGVHYSVNGTEWPEDKGITVYARQQLPTRGSDTQPVTSKR